MEALIALLLLAALFAVGIIYSVLSWGFVFQHVYTWFVLPVFPMLPAISFEQAIGLTLFISLIRPHTYTEYEGAGIKKKTDWWSMILAPWIFLAIAGAFWMYYNQ